MGTVRNANQNGSELDVNKLARIELARLHRQYRLIEDQRHGYTHQSGTTALTTYRILENLRIEKQALEPDLTNATSKANNARAKLAERIIREIVDRYDEYEAVIQKEIRHIKEMEEQVDKISEQVVKQKLKILSSYGMSITPAQANKKLDIAENKLYRMTTLFDQKCHNNYQMRKAVKNLLKERTRFHKKYNYLKHRIGDVKNQTLHVVQQAAQTYDNRDESVSKIKSIREREYKESKQHVLEVKEFQRVLHHDHKIHQFLVTKNTERNVFEDAAQRQFRKDDKKEREVDEILLKYKQSIMQILSQANFQSVDQLCIFYADLEQQNFSRFMYITDITHECEALKDAIGIIKQDIESSQNVVTERKKCRMTELKNRQEKIFAKRELLQHVESVTDGTIDKLGKLVQGIATAFELAGCSNSKVLQLLGNQNGVSQRNAMLCLGILEQQITALKFEKATLDVRKGVELKRQTLHNYNKTYHGAYVKPRAQGGPFKVEVIIPSHLGANADEEDDKEMNDRPYFFEEMREYVEHQMIDEGLIPNKNVTASHAPTGDVSRVASSHMSLIEKVTSKKNARLKAQQEQERNLAKAKTVTATDLEENSEKAKNKKNSGKNSLKSQGVNLELVDESLLDADTDKPERKENKQTSENIERRLGGERSSGGEAEAGFTLTWVTSTEDEALVLPTTTEHTPSEESSHDLNYEE